MIWRGAVFSGILHVGLLVGVVGGLPILPSIFDRSVETSSNDLPILVELVSEATLREISDIAGLQNAAPDAETAQPLPGGDSFAYPRTGNPRSIAKCHTANASYAQTAKP